MKKPTSPSADLLLRKVTRRVSGRKQDTTKNAAAPMKYPAIPSPKIGPTASQVANPDTISSVAAILLLAIIFIFWRTSSPPTPDRGRGLNSGLKVDRSWRMELETGQALGVTSCSVTSFFRSATGCFLSQESKAATSSSPEKSARSESSLTKSGYNVCPVTIL